jgi:hypothetical protein
MPPSCWFIVFGITVEVSSVYTFQSCFCWVHRPFTSASCLTSQHREPFSSIKVREPPLFYRAQSTNRMTELPYRFHTNARRNGYRRLGVIADHSIVKCYGDWDGLQIDEHIWYTRPNIIPVKAENVGTALGHVTFCKGTYVLHTLELYFR